MVTSCGFALTGRLRNARTTITRRWSRELGFRDDFAAWGRVFDLPRLLVDVIVVYSLLQHHLSREADATIDTCGIPVG